MTLWSTYPSSPSVHNQWNTSQERGFFGTWWRR